MIIVGEGPRGRGGGGALLTDALKNIVIRVSISPICMKF